MTHPTTRRRIWPWVAITLALAFGLIVALSRAAGPDVPSAVDTPATMGVATAPSPGIVPVLPTVDVEPVGPLTTFTDGTYEVGTGDGQVPPGRYRASGSGCYWARLRSSDERDAITNHFGDGQTFVTVRASDAYLKVGGCTYAPA